MPESPLSVVRRRFWVVTSYFAEGFPYSVVRLVSSVFFKDYGAGLQAIGLTSLFGLPWNLKFLWGPFVDAFATKRGWLVITELALAAALLAMALASVTPWALGLVSALFLVTACLSATHDISVDGFYLEALNKTEQARYVGFQAMSYRVAMIAGGGGIVSFAGLTSWWSAFLLCAAAMGLLALIHFAFLPRIETPRRRVRELLRFLARPLPWLVLATAATFGGALGALHRAGLFAGISGTTAAVLEKIGVPGAITLALLVAMAVLATQVGRIQRRLHASDSFYALAFVDYLAQPRVGWILTFAVLYRTGESFLLNMVYPFLSDLGISKLQYGVAYGTFGIAASITGGLLGGILISKYGLRRMIWPMAAAQNILNFLYMFLAYHYQEVAIRRAFLGLELGTGPLSAPLAALSAAVDMTMHPEAWAANVYLVTVMVVIEALGAGMGTAAFMVFIQRTTKPSFKAAHFAIATSIMSISATLAGVFSGWLAAWLGWPLYFGFTFLATLPGMACILRLPYLDGSSAADLGKNAP